MQKLWRTILIASFVFGLNACSSGGDGGGGQASNNGSFAASSCGEGLANFQGSCTASDAGGSVCIETYSATGTVQQLQEQCRIQNGTFSSGGCAPGAVNGCRYSLTVPSFQYSTIQFFYGAGFTKEDIAEYCLDLNDPEDPDSQASLCSQ